MDAREPIVANVQVSEGVKPGHRPLYRPTMPVEAVGVLDLAAGDERRDSAGGRRGAVGAGIVAVSPCTFWGRLRGRTPRSRTPRMRSSISGSVGLSDRLAGVSIGGTKGRPQRWTVTWCLLPGSPRSTGLGAVFCPPPPARTVRESTRARDQSTRPAPSRRANSTSINRSRTPASCRSVRRRHAVEPEIGKSERRVDAQYSPVRNTNRITSRASRPLRRRRPPAVWAHAEGGTIRSRPRARRRRWCSCILAVARSVAALATAHEVLKQLPTVVPTPDKPI